MTAHHGGARWTPTFPSTGERFEIRQRGDAVVVISHRRDGKSVLIAAYVAKATTAVNLKPKEETR